jgi:hypothetical protein
VSSGKQTGGQATGAWALALRRCSITAPALTTWERGPSKVSSLILGVVQFRKILDENITMFRRFSDIKKN